MWENIKQLLSPPVFPRDEEKTRVAALLNAILWIFVFICVAAAVLFLFLPNPGLSFPIVGGFILGNAGLLWLMRRGHVLAASRLFLVIFWLLMTAVCVFLGGTYSATYWSYVVIVVAAGLLLGGRGGIIFAGLSVIATLGITLAQTANLLPGALGVRSPMEQWGPLSLFVMATAGLLSLASGSLQEALQRAREYAAEVEEQRASLEVTVEERTRELARRTRYLEVTSAIAREATSELELNALMTNVVNSISREFDFYHTALFLIDPTGEWAELKAAANEGGLKMLARGHRLRVGQEGMVGYVSRRGQSRIALDTGQDHVFFSNPDLPLTRSEAALPLRARGQVIGVLDVQSSAPEAFTPEDVAVLQSLADQIATAINNARLFQQVEESAAAERRAFGGLSAQAWASLLSLQTDLGFVSNRQTTLPAGDTWTPQMQTAFTQGQMAADARDTSLAIPIKVRDRVIGVIDGRKPDGSGQWTPEEIAMMQALAEQSALALESARLYQDTQRRAARERMIGEVTGRIRETLDVEAVLKTAADEIRQALQLERLVVHLGEPGNDVIQPAEKGHPDVEQN
ncbi:MAG: GAF domain-containing protein [Anaerolineae bacterium]|nr:GAF domain-containing protein [Anaerolineae bacterium]